MAYVDPDGRKAVAYDNGMVIDHGLFGDRLVYYGENAVAWAENYNKTHTVKGLLATLAIAVGIVSLNRDGRPEDSEGLENTRHSDQRQEEARRGDESRQVGEPQRVIREGRRYRDSQTGNLVIVGRKGRVVVLTPDGKKRVTQMNNSKRNTQRRAREGRWVPIEEDSAQSKP